MEAMVASLLNAGYPKPIWMGIGCDTGIGGVRK
jgi:hypothetical protein